jgi:ABC-type polysaccharide/polyol phosphate export permease
VVDRAGISGDHQLCGLSLCGAVSSAIVLLLLVTGIRQFRRMEKRFADVI